MIITRFAPSPTGDLHLGGALVALHSYWLAKAHGGRFVVRVEDLDTPRVERGSEERILSDLEWLGFEYEKSAAQSTRGAAYEEALGVLAPETYPCDCSRKEIAQIASAPHEGEEIAYPNLCRDRDPSRPMKRPPAIRLKLPARRMSFVDGEKGVVSAELADRGDLVLRRGDGVFAYQLAVIVDDLDAGVTDVVRGDDLLLSTPRQLYIAELLGARAVPRYAHVPLARDRAGERVAKRTPGATIRALRAGGASKEAILGELAFAMGLTENRNPASLVELLAVSERGGPARPLVVEDVALHLTSAR